MSLEALIADITDEARLKSKKPSGGGSSALYGNSGNKAPGNNNKKSGGSGDKKSKCPGCKDPNPSHSPEKCFTTNEELRKAFEKRTRRTYVPYFRRENNSSNLKTTKKKEKNDDKDGGSFIFVANLNPNFFSRFYYPAFLAF